MYTISKIDTFVWFNTYVLLKLFPFEEVLKVELKI
jgi:hypothetical protein